MRSRSEAASFLLSALLNLALVWGVGTAIVQAPKVWQRIEVDLQNPPPRVVRPPKPPPQATRPPEHPTPVTLPKPAPVPLKVVPRRMAAPPAPRPSAAPSLPPSPTLPAAPTVPVWAPPPAPAVTAPVAPPPPPRAKPEDGKANALAAYAALLHSRIDQAKRYPRWARQARLEGETGVAFRLAPDGRLLEAAVCDPSGHQELDRAAVAAVERAAPYPAFPPAMGRTAESFRVVVSFRIQ